MADTLASLPGGIPRNFVTKIFPLPHINSLVCGTGTLETILEWVKFIELSAIADDIDQLNNISPNNIKDIHDRVTNGEIADTTIYHFGFSSRTKTYKGFAYRAKNAFRSEALVPGLGIKPPDEINLDEIKDLLSQDHFEALKKICISQKEIDDAKDKKQRLGIGGSVYLYLMQGMNLTVQHLMNYDDIQRVSELIRKNGVFE